MCLKIFIPTYRRLVVFLFFALVPLSGVLSFAPPLQVFLTMPFVLIPDLTASVITQVVYLYVIACIYAAVYVWLDKSLGREFPQLNRMLKKKSPAKNRTVKKRRKR